MNFNEFVNQQQQQQKITDVTNLLNKAVQLFYGVNNPPPNTALNTAINRALLQMNPILGNLSQNDFFDFILRLTFTLLKNLPNPQSSPQRPVV